MKDDFFIRSEYRELVAQVLEAVRGDRVEPTPCANDVADPTPG
jgi:hypothetical protein